MSVQEAETVEVEGDVVQSGIIHRTFAAEITPGDGRTVDVRIVPYDEEISHNDGLGGVARGVAYRERWMPGVFDGQLKAANRVLANFEHQEGLAGIVGHGVALREDHDGFYGSFKMHDGTDGDKALMLVKEGVLGGVSVEARPLKSVRGRDNVVQRVKAHLMGVAFTRFAAYSKAVVLAVREQPEFIMDEDLMPTPLDDAIVERCRALGISLPERYTAHPD